MLPGAVAFPRGDAVGGLRFASQLFGRLSRSICVSSAMARLNGEEAGDDGGEREQRDEHRHAQHESSILASEFLDAIEGRWGACFDRFVSEVSLDVACQRAGGFIASVAVLLQGLHDDPVEVASEDGPQPFRLGAALFRDSRQDFRGAAQSGARFGGLFLTNQPKRLGEDRLRQAMLIEWRRSGEQFVQQDTEGVDVAAGVDIDLTQLGLFRRHVLQCADHLPEPCEHGAIGQSLFQGLGHAEVDDLGNRLSVIQAYQDIGGLDISVDDPLLVRMLDCVADRNEQLQAFSHGQPMVIAILRDMAASHQFHDEIGEPAFSHAGVEDLGDTHVVHHGERLPLRLEPCHDLFGIHARFDDLHRHAAFDGMLLVAHVDDPHPSFANRLQELVGTDARPREVAWIVTPDRWPLQFSGHSRISCAVATCRFLHGISQRCK